MLSKVETKSNKVHTNGHAIKQKSGDEIWDELLESPESINFLRKMKEKVRKDIANGDVEEGGFGY